MPDGRQELSGSGGPPAGVPLPRSRSANSSTRADWLISTVPGTLITST